LPSGGLCGFGLRIGARLDLIGRRLEASISSIAPSTLRNTGSPFSSTPAGIFTSPVARARSMSARSACSCSGEATALSIVLGSRLPASSPSARLGQRRRRKLGDGLRPVEHRTQDRARPFVALAPATILATLLGLLARHVVPAMRAMFCTPSAIVAWCNSVFAGSASSGSSGAGCSTGAAFADLLPPRVTRRARPSWPSSLASCAR
jgi:hypothetical protein